MRPPPYDAIVVGLGVTGAAAVCALAARGARVLGVDRHAPPHPFGSSHGERRMIREAYFEAPFYVPLVQAAYRGWEALERRSGRVLLRQTGGVMLGPPTSDLVRGALESARVHGLPHELLETAELGRRFPAFRPSDGVVGVLEPRAGVLDPEGAVRAFLEVAAEDGAELRTGEEVLGWEARGGAGSGDPPSRPARDGADAVRVRTRSENYSGRRLLLAAGAWTAGLVPDLALPLRAERMVQFWFRPRPEARDLSPGRLPVWAEEHAPGKVWYGFPATARGLKVGLHQDGEPSHPDRVRRQVSEEEADEMRAVVARTLPGAAGELVQASVCLYTMTPDRHFLLGPHPSAPEAILASPCSGHGFKFAPAIGEALADLLLDREPAFDLSPFHPARFRS